MTTFEIQTRELDEHPTAVCTGEVSVPEMGPWLSDAFGTVAQVLGQQGAGPAGPPFACFHAVADGVFAVEAGFPASRPVTDAGQVHASTLPGGPVAVTTFVGPYDDMGPAYDALQSWLDEHHLRARSDMWEVYLTDPETEPDPSRWRTEVVAPYVGSPG